MRSLLLKHGICGKCYFVKQLNLQEDVERRFAVLGVTTGVKIQILNKKKSGAMVIKVRGTRFAIGAEFAEGIVVGDETDE